MPAPSIYAQLCEALASRGEVLDEAARLRFARFAEYCEAELARRQPGDRLRLRVLEVIERARSLAKGGG